MSDNDARGPNTWDFEAPDAGLIRGDRPTGAVQDVPTSGPVPPGPSTVESAPRGTRQVSRRRAYLLWLVVAAVSAVLVVAVAVSVGDGDQPPAVELATVPALVDLEQSAAISLIEAQGFVVGLITAQERDDAEVGHVVEQRPTQGAELGVGEAVDLVVASGAETLDVPPVVALTEAEALVALRAAGFETISVESIAGDEPVGTVVSQQPEAGSTVAPETELVIAVSSGPPTERIPDLRGLAADEAVRTLEEIGWDVDTDGVFDDDVTMGDVVGTEPSTRAELQLGEKVTVLVSLGPPSVVLPDLVGVNALEATDEVRALGLEAVTSVCTVKNIERYPSGTVRRQEPAAGSEVEAGSEVTLCITVAGPTPTPLPPSDPVQRPPSNDRPPTGPTDPPETEPEPPGGCKLPTQPGCS